MFLLESPRSRLKADAGSYPGRLSKSPAVGAMFKSI